MNHTGLAEHMKQIVQRWAGIGLMAASVLTVGGMLMLQSGKPPA